MQITANERTYTFNGEHWASKYKDITILSNALLLADVLHGYKLEVNFDLNNCLDKPTFTTALKLILLLEEMEK